MPEFAQANHVCKSGKPYVSGDQARVVLLNGHLWGCVRKQKRARLVAAPSDFGDYRFVTVAGTYAALEIFELSQECESRDVRVVDLRSGRAVDRPAGSRPDLGPCGGSPVTDLVLRSDGLVAFIAGTEVVRSSPYRVASVVLDTSPSVDPGSLSFDRGGVRWTADGRGMRADLPPRRRG